MPATILVIDDDDVFHLDIKRRFPNCNVISAMRIEKGIVKQRSADCIVCDYRMPGVDEDEFIRLIREMASVPVIRVTGHDIEDAERLGLMSKDDMGAIVAKIQEAVEE